MAETADELAAFGGAEVLPESNDTQFDSAIATTTSANGNGMPAKSSLKRRRDTEEVAHWAAGQSDEVHGAGYDLDSTTQHAGGRDDWQDGESYALSQHPLTGEVGERSTAPVVQQNGSAPSIAHVADQDGDGEAGDGATKPLTEADKAARRAAKKAKKAGDKAAMIRGNREARAAAG